MKRLAFLCLLILSNYSVFGAQICNYNNEVASNCTELVANPEFIKAVILDSNLNLYVPSLAYNDNENIILYEGNLSFFNFEDNGKKKIGFKVKSGNIINSQRAIHPAIADSTFLTHFPEIQYLSPSNQTLKLWANMQLKYKEEHGNYFEVINYGDIDDERFIFFEDKDSQLKFIVTSSFKVILLYIENDSLIAYRKLNIDNSYVTYRFNQTGELIDILSSSGDIYEFLDCNNGLCDILMELINGETYLLKNYDINSEEHMSGLLAINNTGAPKTYAEGFFRMPPDIPPTKENVKAMLESALPSENIPYEGIEPTSEIIDDFLDDDYLGDVDYSFIDKMILKIADYICPHSELDEPQVSGISCPIQNGTGWKSLECSGGVLNFWVDNDCELISCDDGYEASGDQCVSTIEGAWNFYHYNCKDKERWLNGWSSILGLSNGSLPGHSNSGYSHHGNTFSMVWSWPDHRNSYTGTIDLDKMVISGTIRHEYYCDDYEYCPNGVYRTSCSFRANK